MRALIFSVVLAGCTSVTGQHFILDALPQVRSTVRDLGRVEVRSCATYVGLWPIPIWLVSSGGSISGFQVETTEEARKQAITMALAKNPEADALMFPRWVERRVSALPWYVETCVNLRAHLGVIEPDLPKPAAPEEGAAATSEPAPAPQTPRAGGAELAPGPDTPVPPPPRATAEVVDQIEARLRGARGLLHMCQKRFAPAAPELRVRLQVTASGRADRIEVVSGPAALGSCVVRAIRSIAFEPPPGGAVSHEHVVQFE